MYVYVYVGPQQMPLHLKVLGYQWISMQLKVIIWDVGTFLEYTVKCIYDLMLGSATTVRSHGISGQIQW